MSFEKILFCFALVGSAGFTLVLMASIWNWVRVRIQRAHSSESKSSVASDEVLNRALRLIQDQSLAIEQLKDVAAAMQQRLDVVEAAATKAVAAPVAEAAAVAPVTKAPRRRSTKVAAPAAAKEETGVASMELPAHDELSMMGALPPGVSVVQPMEMQSWERPSNLTLGEQKFEVIA